MADLRLPFLVFQGRHFQIRLVLLPFCILSAAIESQETVFTPQ
jgi:hypothetical protein